MYDAQIPVWKTAVDWIVRQFQWQDDPCQKYHEALLVDPFWEVTPLVVSYRHTTGKVYCRAANMVLAQS